MIENTGKRDPLLHLLGAMSEGSSGYIEGMEAAGQRQVVGSTKIPTRGSDELEALGFKLGDIDKNDKLFRDATLPDGWKKEGSDHAMWSYIVDTFGRRRVSIFYKAAWYDRDAFCRVQSVNSYLWELSHEHASPVFDDEWCTAAAVVEAAEGLIKQRRETVDLYTRPDVVKRERAYAAERVAESQTDIAWAEALIASCGVS